LTEASIQPTTVRSVTEFTLDGVRYSIDPPTQETYVDDTSNNSSLIVTVQNGENRLLFMGDAEKDRMAEFIPRMEGSYDLVKLPHHGQWENNLSELLQAAAPRYAVITSSEEIPEDTRTTDWLAEQGIEALLTRIAPISIVSDGQTLTAGYV
jgi:beta-lactamase superfamily II metal-dependent hydrolase